MKTLYLDCFSGISGDMLLGALVDLGARVRPIREALNGLGLDFSLRIERVESHGISARKVRVAAKGKAGERSFEQIKNLIGRSRLAGPVKEIALRAFELLAMAESRVHGCSVCDVHFHEVGAVDSIVDVVGSALAVFDLGIERVISSPLPIGRGFVMARHGTLPLPAPAALEILKGVPVYGDPREHELVTPTGAALLVALTSEFGLFPRMVPKKVGYGAGDHKDPSRPNLLRAVLGEAELGMDRVWIVECDIDDQSPELFPPLVDAVMGAGALDVSLVQAMGKKGRPKYVISALVHGDKRGEVARVMLEHSSTLGVRSYAAEREMLARKTLMVDVRGVSVRIKIGILNGRVLKLKPEFEDCKRLAKARGIPLASAVQLAIVAANEQGVSVGKKL